MRSASLFSLIVGMTLVGMKAVTWLMSDSFSMMSSLADSLLDVMASGVNFIAIRYALQPPDKEHRFGHGKAEDLATLAQSTFICGSGFFLVIEGIKRFFWPEPVNNSTAAIVVMVISIVMTLALVIYQRYVVRRTSSSAIAADATHYIADLINNAGVIIALVLTTRLGFKMADPLIGLIIAAYLIYSAVVIGKGAFNNLMDREFSDEERNKVKDIVKQFGEICSIHELRTRRSGITGFIQFHLTFQDENVSLKHAHEISDKVEDALKAVFPHIEILIHQDPLHGDRS